LHAVKLSICLSHVTSTKQVTRSELRILTKLLYVSVFVHCLFDSLKYRITDCSSYVAGGRSKRDKLLGIVSDCYKTSAQARYVRPRLSSIHPPTSKHNPPGCTHTHTRVTQWSITRQCQQYHAIAKKKQRWLA